MSTSPAARDTAVTALATLNTLGFAAQHNGTVIFFTEGLKAIASGKAWLTDPLVPVYSDTILDFDAAIGDIRALIDRAKSDRDLAGLQSQLMALAAGMLGYPEIDPEGTTVPASDEEPAAAPESDDEPTDTADTDNSDEEPVPANVSESDEESDNEPDEEDETPEPEPDEGECEEEDDEPEDDEPESNSDSKKPTKSKTKGSLPKGRKFVPPQQANVPARSKRQFVPPTPVITDEMWAVLNAHGIMSIEEANLLTRSAITNLLTFGRRPLNADESLPVPSTEEALELSRIVSEVCKIEFPETENRSSSHIPIASLGHRYGIDPSIPLTHPYTYWTITAKGVKRSIADALAGQQVEIDGETVELTTLADLKKLGFQATGELLFGSLGLNSTQRALERIETTLQKYGIPFE